MTLFDVAFNIFLIVFIDQGNEVNSAYSTHEINKKCVANVF